jgi:hypothetical protein
VALSQLDLTEGDNTKINVAPSNSEKNILDNQTVIGKLSNSKNVVRRTMHLMTSLTSSFPKNVLYEMHVWLGLGQILFVDQCAVRLFMMPLSKSKSKSISDKYIRKLTCQY